MGLLSQMVRNQARVMAYLDAFWIFWIMALAALPLVLLMKKAVTKGSRHALRPRKPSSRGHQMRASEMLQITIPWPLDQSGRD